jgi:endonuclease VIII
MPEGDTIFRAAAVLDKALAGKTVTGWRSPLPGFVDAKLEGHVIARVQAQGKNLLIHFDDTRVIRTHLRMTGSWHLYRAGERWQRPERQANLVVEAGELVAVCFNAPVVELLRAGGAERHPQLRALGPDLLKADFNPEEARRRLRDRGDQTIGEALMVQAVLAGIGNVYKSEVLFLLKTSPFLRVDALSDALLDALVAKAGELMTQNLDGTPRTTRHALTGGRYWVYGRSGMPCFRCRTLIKMRRQGLAGRSTYYCPVCQAESG